MGPALRRVERTSGAGNVSPHFAETSSWERSESCAGLFSNPSCLDLWHADTGSTQTWDFWTVSPEKTSIGKMGEQVLGFVTALLGG